MTQAYIVTECLSDAAIIKQVLPKPILHNIKLVDGESPYGAESIASTLLAAKRLPVILGSVCKPGDPPRPPLKRGENSVKVPPFKGDLGGSEFDRVVCRRALVINAKTNDELMISERASELNYLLRQASPGIPFNVLIAVPELEVVFFQERELLEELIGKKLTDLEWQFAQHHPKELLDNLLLSSTTFIKVTLNKLDDQKLQVLRQHPLIEELIKFLRNAALKPQQVSPA